MNESLKILVVDDIEDIRELIINIVGAEYPTLFWEADCGKQADEMLKQNQFDLVISDFNMPNGNGKYVFDCVQKMNPKPKYILSTSDTEKNHQDILSLPECGFIQKPFESNNLIKMVSFLLKIIPIDHSKTNFFQLPSTALYKLDILPFAVYLNLGKNHHIKYFNESIQFTEFEKERLQSLEKNEVFVRAEDYHKFIEESQRSAFKSLVLPKDGIEYSFQMNSVKNELIHCGLKGILDDRVVIESTQKTLKTVFALTTKVNVFNGLLDWVENSKHSPIKIHSILITLFCNIILKNQNNIIYDFQNLLSLGYAAVLHDLYLDDFFVRNEFRITNGIKHKSQINKSEQEILYDHVSKIAQLVTSWAHCPKEVINVIAQHHEKANGTGFPHKLNGNAITGLSAIFNVAHDLADLVLEHKTGDDLKQNLNSLINEYKGYKHFEDSFDIIKREVFLEHIS